MDDIAVSLRKILVEEMGIDYSDITDDATLAYGLDLDSIEMVDLANRIEMTFNIEIPDSAVQANMTVGQVADKIRELKGA